VRSPSRSLPVRLALSATIALSLLAALEAALRVFGFRNPVVELPMLVWNQEEDRLMKTGDYLYQADPDCLWEPRPGALVRFGKDEAIDGPPEQVNAAGFRGPEVPLARTPGTLRVATLGDSSSFGLGVRFEQCFTARLVERMKESGVAVEGLAAGVEGYTVRQGIERYKKRVRPYRPDVVVAGFGCVNEHWAALDGGDAAKIAAGRRERSALAGFAREVRSELRLAHLAAWIKDRKPMETALARSEQRGRIMKSLASEDGAADWPGERRVSLAAFAADLRELASEVAKDGARLVLVSMPRRIQGDQKFPVLPAYNEAVIAAAKELHLQLLDARMRFRVRGSRGAGGEELMQKDWWHPSAAGHELIGGWLAELVRDPSLQQGADTGAVER
jgi:lysophospholipase L1-like esterase